MSSEQSRQICIVRTPDDTKGRSEGSGLFSNRKPREILERISLIEENIKEGELVLINRDLFGPTTFGDYAFGVIASGVKCRAYIVDDRSEDCLNQAWLTVDFDVHGDGDLIPVCGMEHFKQVEKRINHDLQNQGLSSYIGINGFGRERSS